MANYSSTKKRKDIKKLKVGDRIVHFGSLYRIFKIKKKVLFYKPLFKKPVNKTVVRSLPLDNVDQTDIRRPLSRYKLRQLLKNFSKIPDLKNPVNLVHAKSLLGLNAAYETAQVLKNLWREKKDPMANFSKSKEEVFKKSMRRLAEEIACIRNISLDEAREKIRSVLKGSKK